MKDTIKYVGLDVSKEKIAVAIAEEGREEPRYWGIISHTPEAVKKLMKKLGSPESLRVCYEAGPTGYPLSPIRYIGDSLLSNCPIFDS